MPFGEYLGSTSIDHVDVARNARRMDDYRVQDLMAFDLFKGVAGVYKERNSPWIPSVLFHSFFEGIDAKIRARQVSIRNLVRCEVIACSW